MSLHDYGGIDGEASEIAVLPDCGWGLGTAAFGMAGDEGLRGQVLALMGRRDYQPRTKGEMSRELELHADRRSELRAVLAHLEREGVVVRGGKGRYKLRKHERNLLVGTLKMRLSGGAWFFADQQDEGNLASGIDLDKYRRILIPAQRTSVALDGDRVQARIDRLGPPDWKRHKKGKRGGKKGVKELPGAEAEAIGRVDRILERRSGVVVGTYLKKGKFASVTPDDEHLPRSIALAEETSARLGQKVAVELIDWDRRDAPPRGRVVKILGWPGDPGVDILAIIEAHGLRREFPDEVLVAARAVPDMIPEEELAGREDWRNKFVITIDPEDAKDFDDAIDVRKLEHGWELAVHIADVSHYVKPDGPLDQEAVERGNSTYLVDRVLPMLPPELSNGICSLRPQEDRLTCVAVMKFNAKGEMGKTRFGKAVINSKARLTYEEAQALLVAAEVADPEEGGEEGQAARLEGMADRKEVGAAVTGAWELARILRRRRFRNGALDLEFPEIRVVLDDAGIPTGYKREDYNESHQLVEECMLAANEAVAGAIKNGQRPGIYRVHEEPDVEKLFEFGELARSHGYAPGDLTNKKHIQRLLDAVRGKPEEHAMKLGLLKSLKRAAYSLEPLGHYGLSKTDYCHFTSPIRRYADLIVHRSLEPLLGNPPEVMDRLPSKAHCAEIASQISDTERVSASAEDATRRLKMMEWLKICSERVNPPVFRAVITDVKRIGLMVEATEILQRGVVKREEFSRGSWRLEAHRMRYVSRDGELALGQVIQVVVENVNMERQFVDFRIVEE